MGTVESSSFSYGSTGSRPVHVLELPRLATHLFKRAGTRLIDKSLYFLRNSLLKKFPKGALSGAKLLSTGGDELLKLPPETFTLYSFGVGVLPRSFNRS